MSDKGTKITFGGRQARALCNMRHSARLDFISEGLPIILQSAQGFWRAAETLEDNPREAAVLSGLAEEESAKALILIDLVRCPVPEVGKRIGRIVKKTLYDHLSRMIYANAQSWRPTNIAQLQEYVDNERQGHLLDGGMSEYIVPNWSLYLRESTMYADIEVHEEGIPQWNDPNRWGGSTIAIRPIALQIVEALEVLGVMTRAGLQATSDIWGNVDFVKDEGPVEARELSKQLGRLGRFGHGCRHRAARAALLQPLAASDVQSQIRFGRRTAGTAGGTARGRVLERGGRILGSGPINGIHSSIEI